MTFAGRFVYLLVVGLVAFVLFCGQAECQTYGQATTSPLSEPRRLISATSTGNLAFFAGGWRPSASYSYSAAVDIYDISTGIRTNATLSSQRLHPCAVSLGNLVFFAGGFVSTGLTTDVVDIYNVDTGMWSIASLSVARSGAVCTSFGGDVVMFAGGLVNGSLLTNVVDIYNSTEGAWSTMTSVPTNGGWGSAVTVGDLVILAGGISTKTVNIYNVTALTWGNASLSVARTLMAVTSVRDLVIFAGGALPVSSAVSTVVDIYNVTSGEWATSSLSSTSVWIASGSVGDLAFFAGGGPSVALLGIGGGDVPNGRVDIYNASNNTWSTASLSQARFQAGGVSVGNLFMVAGGGGEGSTDYAIVDVFNMTKAATASTPLATTLTVSASPTPSPSPSVTSTASASSSSSLTPSVTPSPSVTPPSVLLLTLHPKDRGRRRCPRCRPVHPQPPHSRPPRR
jgi:hypothetical protein